MALFPPDKVFGRKQRIDESKGGYERCDDDIEEEQEVA